MRSSNHPNRYREALAEMESYVFLRAIFATLAFACCFIPAHGQDASNSGKEVVVFAAASMAPALNPLAEKYQKEKGIKLVISYASSSALAQQIQNGAPAQVYISADPVWAAKLQETKHAAQKVDFLGNTLVLIVPAKARAIVTKPEDLQNDAVKHIAIGDPASVPAGKYAKEALETLGLWTKLEPKFVPAADVRQALLYVERGEAEAGIVYGTDAKSSEAVRPVAVLDDHLKAPVKYSLVLTTLGDKSQDAKDVFAFLLSDETLKAFETAGFSRLSEPKNAGASKP